MSFLVLLRRLHRERERERAIGVSSSIMVRRLPSLMSSVDKIGSGDCLNRHRQVSATRKCTPERILRTPGRSQTHLYHLFW
ncbi:unnamed protein product [Musa acuminata var. zebrina]